MQPYADSLAHLRDELERVNLLLRLHVDEMGGGTEQSGEGIERMYVSEEEVMQLLRPGEGTQSRTNEGLRQRIKDRTTTLKERVSTTIQKETPLRFAALADNFALSRAELDALLLALAPELDRKYEKVYGFLRDDITSKRPTVGTILQTISRSESERLGSLTLFSSSSPLVRWDLLKFDPDSQSVPKLSRSVYVDRQVVEYLTGADSIDQRLAEFARLDGSSKQVADLKLADTTRERVSDLVAEPARSPAVYYLYGPAGSGRGDVAEALATRSGVPRLVVDTPSVPGSNLGEILSRLKREALLRGAAIQFENVDRFVDQGDVAMDSNDILEALTDLDRHVFLTGTESWTPNRTLPGHEFVSVEVHRPPFSLRKELWNEHADVLPDGVEPDELASKFSLTRGQIEDALFTARGFADGTGLTPEAVYRGCRAQSSAKLEELAQKTETTYDWEDIVLPEQKERQLREVGAHVRHRGTVYSEWGFEEKFSIGNGLTVLFTGPSGTGKTMAAGIIAGNAGLDLYKVDIASVVSKYIGETEKNLGRIFDEAEHSNAILFFDEADALFGQRSEVSDSQDRYANVEVNYLLQRVEEHDGTVIMTTNFEQNIDDAFQRRLDVSVDFPRPGQESRRAIWENIFPAETPVGEIDYEFLSSFDVTGGNIKNIAQTAAFLAADDTGVVEMEHLVAATKQELEKLGKLVNPSEFDEYQELLSR